MKAAESLFEFMPYGAPELLQSRRERLASSLLASALLIAALFAAAGSIARLVAVPPVVIPVVNFEPHDLVRPPSVLEPPTGPAIPHPTTTPIEGVPVPKAEPDEPLAPSAGPSAGTSVEGPEFTGTATEHTLAPPVADDALPPPDTHVYAEQYPQPVTQVKPDYPEIAREAGVEGLVIVKVMVGKTGHVLDARLDSKRQVPLLNAAALEAARKWVFTPALANGRPVAVWTAIPFQFVLR
jgi:protein TonB